MMGTLCKLFLNIVDPLGIIRKHIIYPSLNVFSTFLNHYRSKADESVSNAREVILRFIIIGFAVALIIWTAIFMYVAFYYAYMPAIAHIRPVHMQFQSCREQKGPCNFPHAHVSLSKKQQLLMIGQSYKILINIDMPESPQNQNLGMFMVCADMRDHTAVIRGHSCRSAMLRYKSPIVQIMTTWIFSPLLVFGLKEENQLVPVELFSNFEEEQMHPVTDVYVEIQSLNIQFYSVTLHITADFTGLRYIMFHWPILSAAMGISTNLFFILIIFTLSWYHWSDTTWIKEVREKYYRFRSIALSSPSTPTLSSELKDLSSGVIDEGHNLVDDDDLSILDEEKSDDVEEVSGIEHDDHGVESSSTGSEKIKKITTTQTEFLGY